MDILAVPEILKGKSLPDKASLARLPLPRDLDFEIIPLTPCKFERKLNLSFFRKCSMLIGVCRVV